MDHRLGRLHPVVPDLGIEAPAAPPDVLAAYLSELAQPDDRPAAAVATIERRLSAIAQAHRVAGSRRPGRTRW